MDDLTGKGTGLQKKVDEGSLTIYSRISKMRLKFDIKAELSGHTPSNTAVAVACKQGNELVNRSFVCGYSIWVRSFSSP